jgi:hypothetical protein
MLVFRTLAPGLPFRQNNATGRRCESERPANTQIANQDLLYLALFPNQISFMVWFRSYCFRGACFSWLQLNSESINDALTSRTSKNEVNRMSAMWSRRGWNTVYTARDRTMNFKLGRAVDGV